MKDNTREAYRSKIKHFLNFLVKALGPSVPKNLYGVTHLEHGQYLSLPGISSFIEKAFPDDVTSLNSKCQAINGYKKFCDFLLNELKDEVDNFGMEDYLRRKEHLLNRREEAGTFDKKYSERIKVGQEARELHERLDDGKEPIPTTVL